MTVELLSPICPSRRGTAEASIVQGASEQLGDGKAALDGHQNG